MKTTYEELDQTEKDIVDQLRRFGSWNKFKTFDKVADLDRVYSRRAYVIETEYNYLKLIAFPLEDTVEEKKLAILKFCELNGRRPSKGSKNPVEKTLSKALNSYTSPNGRSYDEEFTKTLNEKCPPTSVLKKQQILDFIEINGRRPNIRCKNPIEKTLGKAISTYTSPSANSYDEEFTKTLNEKCPVIDLVPLKKQQIIEFIEINGRRPNRRSKNLSEKTLGQAIGSYTKPNGGSYDEEFTKILNEKCPVINTSVLKKQQIIEFIEINGRRPFSASKNLSEKRLGEAISSYTNLNGGSYDEEFTKAFKKAIENIKPLDKQT